MEEIRQENSIRKVLKSEITWIILIISFVVTFFTKVIIPINNMQIQLISIQSDVSGLKSFDGRITDNSNNILIMQQQIKMILQEIKKIEEKEGMN